MSSKIFSRGNTNFIILTAVILFIAAVVFIFVPSDVHAVSGPVPQVTVTPEAKLVISWTAPADAGSKTHYVLKRVDSKNNVTTQDITNGKTSYTEDTAALTDKYNYKYAVAYYSGTELSSFSSYTYLGYVYKPLNLSMKKSELTVNAGKKRTLRLYTSPITTADMPFYQFYYTGRGFCDTSINMADRRVHLYGYWSSSNESVASVSQTGQITAAAPGKTTITFTSVFGRNASAVITVPKTAEMEGSIYILEKNELINRTILGSKLMVKGTQNRLNGTVKASYTINKLYFEITNSQGQVTDSYTKYVGAKTYNLSKASVYVPFSSAGKGLHYVNIYADYKSDVFGAGAKQKIYSEKFRVYGTSAEYLAKANLTKGEAIAKWGTLRIDDPYSQSERGTSNYTDCSYLTLWAVRQVLGNNDYSEQPRADLQYKYIVAQGGTLSKSQLMPGDMICYVNGSSFYYKKIGHIEIYLGNNLTVGAGTPGYTLIDTYKKTPCTKILYGRPY